MTHRADGSCAIQSLCVVGDEDQSIYSWRGATIENLVTFAHEFPATQSITIAQNYRSVQPILNRRKQHHTSQSHARSKRVVVYANCVKIASNISVVQHHFTKLN